jgi:DNA polymerase III subunit epsilon
VWNLKGTIEEPKIYLHKIIKLNTNYVDLYLGFGIKDKGNNKLKEVVMTNSNGIKEFNIHETPIAIVDVETTGLTPGIDRVVEVSVFKIEPGKNPYLAFDTLVNPLRPMGATEIHGITDEDVADAPVFGDIAGNLVDALSGCVMAAYNVYFDIKFLDYELKLSSIKHQPPHFCLMYMRPMLDLGKRCNLETACHEHGIDYQAAHIAAVDVEASAKLMKFYLEILSKRKIHKYGQLANLCSYKFISSFINDPFPKPEHFSLKKSEKFLSRAGFKASPATDPQQHAMNEYWDALKAVLTDLEITDEEFEYIIGIRKKIQLPKEKIRMLHAKAFASVTCQFIADKSLDDKEVLKLRRLSQCLSKLGWAPGE